MFSIDKEHCIVYQGPANVDVIGTLVELGADVSVVMENASMETPLHIAARSGRLDIVQKLLRCGVSVTAKTKDGSRPLHYAAAFGQTHVLEALVHAGCEIDAKDDAQNTPLHLAAGSVLGPKTPQTHLVLLLGCCVLVPLHVLALLEEKCVG